MKDIFSSLVNTPIPVILIIFGLILLLLAIGVQLKTTIVTTNVKPSVAGTMGIIFLTTGLVLNSPNKLVSLDESLSKSDEINLKQGQQNIDKKKVVNADSAAQADNVTYKEKFYPNGKKKQRLRYEDQELNGESIYFNEQGHINFKTFYRKGVKIRSTEIYETGEKKTEFRLIDGVRQGVSIGYFKSGLKRYEWLYKNGNLNGESLEFNSEGKIVSRFQYENGKFVK